jgi:hypothetical protein
MRANLPTPPKAKRIRTLYTENLNGALCVGLITENDPSNPAEAYAMSISVWTKSGPARHSRPLFVDSSIDDCIGSDQRESCHRYTAFVGINQAH